MIRPSRLTDALDLFVDELPPALVGQEAREGLRRAAERLPAVSLAGIECRLGAGEGRVDLQLAVMPRFDDRAAVVATLEAIVRENDLPDAARWENVRRFCLEWSEPHSRFQRGISQLWLEIDRPDGETPPLLGAVFITLVGRLDATDAFDVSRDAVESLCGRSLSTTVARTLRRAIEAAPRGASISHVGAMVGREGEMLRVNFQGIAPRDVAPFLQKIGRPLPDRELELLCERFYSRLEILRVCLDLGASVGPRIGLECFSVANDPLNPSWQAFLEDLVEAELCTVEKRDQLVAWPGRRLPIDGDGRWPDGWIAASLLKPANQLGLFERRTSHVKLDYEPQKPLRAKAYFGFAHRWRSFGDTARKSEPLDDGAAIRFRWRARHYYDRMTPVILEHVGPSYQSGLLDRCEEGEDRRQASNLFWAARAAVEPGEAILDAGAGACGPAVDIAKRYDGVRVDAVTISPVEARAAREHIRSEALGARVRVSVGDFNELPFAAASFDLVLFLEAAGHTYDRRGLFAEAYRVLRPGGRLYVKELFLHRLPRDGDEAREVGAFGLIYACRMVTATGAAADIAAAGFGDVEIGDLSDVVSRDYFDRETRRPTEFGRYHRYAFDHLPSFYGDIRATKPSRD